MTVDQRSVWYQAMLNGFMKAEKLRVVARGGKEQEVTKTVAAAKLEEWATDWTNFGGVDVQMLKERRASQGRRGRRRRQGRGAEETDKWGPDQKNFMQRWLFWCEDPLKPAVDGKPAIAQDIAARQDFLDTRPKDKAHELSIFTAHRELASFQYFDSLIQAPIMSCEAPPSNLIKIMEVAKNLIEAAKQFAHIKFLENPLMAACKQLTGLSTPYWTVVMTLPPRSTGMEQCPNTILLNEDDDPEPSADTDFVASTPLQKRVLEARNVEGPPKSQVEGRRLPD
eukprot:jgi/Mesvir1/17920/Mv12983-RA.1